MFERCSSKDLYDRPRFWDNCSNKERLLTILKKRIKIRHFFLIKKMSALLFRRLDILSTCHFVNLPFCQLAILSTCHFVDVQFCQLAFLSTCHFVNLPFVHKHEMFSVSEKDEGEWELLYSLRKWVYKLKIQLNSSWNGAMS